MIQRFLFIICCALLHLTTNAQWSVTGNAKSAGNFLGTTNVQDLTFKIGNVVFITSRCGVVSVSNSNTGLGLWTLGNPSVVGMQNSAFGNNALAGITSSAYANVAVGYLSLNASSNSGNTNTAAGIQTLYSNATGGGNTVAGGFALYHNTTAINNNALGVNALQQNTTISYNNAMGTSAGYSNTSGGPDLCAMGDHALYSNTSGFTNLAIGSYAAYKTTMAFYNVSIGINAMYNNTNLINQYGSKNVAVGSNTLVNVGDGIWNVAIGYNALPIPAYSSANNINATVAFGGDALANADATTGSNVAFGKQALLANTTGRLNTAVGELALSSNTTGIDNTAIGAASGPGSSYPSLTNATAIGYQATNFASNQVVIGNTSVTVIGGYAPATLTAPTGWTNFSDGRYKKNIKENVPGLNYINKIRPITYNVDVTGLNNFLKIDNKNTDQTAVRQKEKITYSGFLAQEVEAVGKSVGFDFNAVYKPESDTKGLYGLSYEQFVVPLVKAAQELSKDNDKLQNDIIGLQSRIYDLKQQITTLARVNTSL